MVETELTETGLVLARRGQDALGSSFEQPCYRIPALAVTASGRLLAAWDVRADWRDLPGPFDLVVRHSDDDGRTWTPPRHLRAHESGRGFGTPACSSPRTAASCASTRAVRGELLLGHGGRPGARAVARRLGRRRAHLDVPRPHRRPAAVRDRGDVRVLGQRRPAGGRRARRTAAPAVRAAASDRGTPRARPCMLDAAEHWSALARSDDGDAPGGSGRGSAPTATRTRWSRPRPAVSTPGRGRGGGGRPRPTAGRPSRRRRRTRSWWIPACNGGLCRWDGVLVCSLLDDDAERRRLVLRTSVDEGAMVEGVRRRRGCRRLLGAGAAGRRHAGPAVRGGTTTS